MLSRGWAVVAQHIQSHAADEGQVFGGMGLPGPAGILAELHVQDPVLLVFDAPVAAHDGGEPVPFWERAQEVAAFGAGFFPDDAVDSTRPTACSPAQSGLASSQSIELLSA